MTVFADGEFHVKLKGLFQSFDVDSGGTIDRSEFLRFVSVAILGLCKLLSLKPPSRNQIYDYAYKKYKEVDTNLSGVIEFDEFERWIKDDVYLQEFLL